MKNATEVVTELYRKFPKVEFIDERDLGEDIVGLMFEYRDTEVDEEQLKAYLDSIGNWYRVRESREFYGGKSLLVKAEDDYVSLPVEDDFGDFGYSRYDDKHEPDYLLGEAVEGERAFMLRKGVLPDGTDSMLFIVSPSNRLCIVNGKEGMNDPTNTEPLYMQGEKATIGGWEEELDKDTIVSLYLHQDGIVLDDADEEIDTDEDPEEGRFKRIASKSVQDSDGFYTDYTWYFDNEDRKHVFVFGDTDVYYPEDGYYDWEVEGDDEQAQAEAQEWFDSYDGFEEDDYNESLKESSRDEVSELKDRLRKIQKELERGENPERLDIEKGKIMDRLSALGVDDGWYDESLEESKSLKEERSVSIGGINFTRNELIDLGVKWYNSDLEEGETPITKHDIDEVAICWRDGDVCYMLDPKYGFDVSFDDITRLYSSKNESLKEASYGGAFDIEDNQFFTRDDLNELMNEINDRCQKGMQATGIYMSNDGRTLEVDMEDEDWGGDTIYKKIDMRKIRKPSDLLRYADSIITEFENTVSKWKES